MPRWKRDLTGVKFDRWTVISFDEIGSTKKMRWNCYCDCGERASVRADSLVNGSSQSCGCHMREAAHSRSTHGGRGTPEYKTWWSMIKRCSDPKHPKFKDYGARGIVVCDRWKDFRLFLEDMGKRPLGKKSIERLDVNGNYEPSNCSWETAKVQACNRRNTRKMIFNGEVRKLVDVSAETGIKIQTLHTRCRKGTYGSRYA